MKYLLVIGAGENQVPIIMTAKNMGCYVYVVTIAGDYPGINLADEWIEKDIFDRDGIISYLLENNKVVDGIISDQSDMAAVTVAYIAEKLNLPTWGYQNSLYFTNKSLMREIIGAVGLPVPDNKITKTLEEAIAAAESIGYPIVIKPTDSFSSRGVSLVSEFEELQLAFNKAVTNSRRKEVIVEKYIKGKQFFSQGFVSDYKLNMFAFSDRYYYDLDNIFIPYTNAFPALIDEDLKNRMKNDFESIIKKLKPRFGHVWAEWILDDESNELYIVEIAIRGAGAYVTTDIIPYAYGIDTQEYLIREALGEKTNFYDKKISDCKSAAFYSFLLPQGEIEAIHGLDKINDIKGIIRSDIKNMNIGDITTEIQDKSSRYGTIVVGGENRDEVNRIWNELKETIHIIVKTENGKMDVIWE